MARITRMRKPGGKEEVAAEYPAPERGKGKKEEFNAKVAKEENKGNEGRGSGMICGGEHENGVVVMGIGRWVPALAVGLAVWACPVNSLADGLPTVNNGVGATNIGVGTAWLNGEMVSTGGVPTEVYIYWGADAGNWANTNYLGTNGVGAFSLPVSNLYYGLRYYYRCYATNSYGGTWADAATNFVTLAPPLYRAGLLAGYLGSAWDTTTANPGTTNFLGPHAGRYGNLNPPSPWADNRTWVYTGQIFFNGGICCFAENVDDNTLLKIDGTTYINDPTYNNVAVSGGITKTSGWHNVEIRFGNGGGGAGPAGTSGWTATVNPYGFGYNTNGVNDGVQSHYVYPEDDGTMRLFRYLSTNAASARFDISDTGATPGAPGSGVLTALLLASNSVCDAWVYWGPTDGGTNAGAWTNSAYVGSFTNVPSTNLSYTVSGLPGDSYWYTFRITNVCTNIWAVPSVAFSPTPDPQYWHYKMKITFSGYTRGETLTNFPAVVVFGTAMTNGFSYRQMISSNGWDLRFMNAEETQGLNYEIERWDSTTNSYVWVQVPQLTNNCYIWAYWGNPLATNQMAYTANGATWDTNFNGVWHLCDTNATDSTTHRNRGTSYGNTNTAGKIAGAQDFNGSSYYVEAINLPALTTAFTFSLWAKPNASQGSGASLLNYWSSGWGLIEELNGDLRVYNDDYWQWSSSSGLTFDSGNWQHIVFTWDKATGDVVWYTNGVRRVWLTGQTANSLVKTAIGSKLRIGARSDGNYFGGPIDEVEISQVARSSNWVWACWLNMASNTTFCGYGGVQSDRPLILSYAATNITANSADLVGNLLSTGAAPTAVTCYWGLTNGNFNPGNWATTNSLGGKDPGYVTNSLSSLTAGARYYYTFYATNSCGDGWGVAADTFVTLGTPTLVDNDGGPTNITLSSATLRGTLQGGNPTANTYIYWGPADGGNDPSAWTNAANTGVSADSFSTNVTGLRSSKVYYYRCYATNSYGGVWASSSTNFLTPAPTVTLSMAGSPFMENGGTATVTATINNPSASNVTVVFTFSGGAVRETDYAASATTIVVAAGSVNGSITLTGLDDAALESPESVIVTISSATNSIIGSPSSVTGSIISDDPQITNLNGASNVTYNAAALWGNLTYGYTGTVFVYWGTFDGTNNKAVWANTNSMGVRNEGGFSTNLTGLLASQKYYYRCYVTNNAGEDWADTSTNFTTLPAPVSISDVTVTEGNSGTTNALFSVTLSGPSCSNLSVNFTTSDGTAVAGSDYIATNGILIFNAGETSKFITVTVIGDTLEEWPSEVFYVNLSNPTNCTIADNQGLGTIIDDDVGTANYAHKMKITFTGYNRGETLTNFPALVVFRVDMTNGFSYDQVLSTNGWDLRFQNAQETQYLNYELEQWDTNGNSCVWVQVPELTNNCYIWAYWGNANMTSAPAVYTTNGATWNTNYAGVWHLPNGTTLTARDSTSNTNHGTVSGATATQGVADGAANFNGSSAYVKLTALPGYDLNTVVSISFWANISQIKECDLLQRGLGNVSYGHMIWLKSNAQLDWCSQAGSSGLHLYSTPMTSLVNQWVHVVCTKSTTDTSIFFNGALNVSKTVSYSFSRTDEFYLGYGMDGYYKGAMDEVRISPMVLSTNWIWAEYMNTASNEVFNSYGLVGPPVINNANGASNITTSSATLCGNLVSTGTSATVVYVCYGTNSGAWSYTNCLGTGSVGPLSTNVTGLLPATVYYYRFYATNSAGGAWARVVSSFMTSTDFSYYPLRMKISFTNYTRLEPLTNFPALVVFRTDMSNGFAYWQVASTNGWDLRFQNSDETQILNYEIERWATNTNSYVWVQVPVFTNNCWIWANWGYPNAAAAPAVYTTNGATWSQGYRCVWHLREGGTGTRYDSVAGYAGTPVGVQGTNGIIDGADYFNGSSAYINSTYGQPSVTAYTVTAWVKTGDNGGNKLIFHDRGTGPGKSLSLGLRSGGGKPFYALDSDNILIGVDATGSISDNNWHHVAGVWSTPSGVAIAANNFSLCLDGYPASVTTVTTGSQNSPVQGAGAAQIAYHQTWGTYLNAGLDEIRASTVVRSTNWIWAEWMNEGSNSTFNTYGTAQGRYPTVFRLW